MERSTDPRRNDGDRTTAEAVDDRADIYKKTFGLAPETARLVAEDTVASRERNPASDDVDEARAARARAEGAR